MREVSADEAWLRKYPERTVLVASVDSKGHANLIALGWNMPTSHSPPIAAISIGITRYSHQLIHESQEFVLVFPSYEMQDQVMYCGTYSGRDVDKFQQTGLTPVPAKFVQPPLVKEAVVNMECQVIGELRTGDHTLFAGEVLTAYISDKAHPVLFNMGPDEHGHRRFRGF